MLLAGGALGCAASSEEGAALRVPGELYTREDARKHLAELARRYERLMRDHGYHEWARYAGKLDEGPAAQKQMEKLRQAEHELFTDADEVFQRFGQGVVAPRLQRLWELGALGLKLLGDKRAAELSDALEAVINGHQFLLDGKKIARGELITLRRSEDPAQRRRARQLEHELHVKAAPVASELIKRRIALAQELGLRSFYDSLLELRGITTARLMGLVTELNSYTRRAQYRLLYDLRKSATGALTIYDLDFAVFRHVRPPEERFDKERAIPTVKRLYAAFGIDLENPKLDLTIRDFAFGGQSISIHVPDDVRIVVTPAPGARFWGTLLHELGHAYAATRTHAEHPLYAGYEWVPGLSDPAFAEGLAEVFGRLLDEPRVLKDYVGLNDEETLRMVEARRVDTLLRVPRTLSSINFERIALEQPAANLDQLSLDLERTTLGLVAPRDAEPIWAASPFLATYPVYGQSYLLAAMMAVQVRDALKARFGPDWVTPDAGRHLTEGAVEDGARWTLDEKLVRTTGSPLEIAPLVRFLNAEPFRG